MQWYEGITEKRRDAVGQIATRNEIAREFRKLRG